MSMYSITLVFQDNSCMIINTARDTMQYVEDVNHCMDGRSEKITSIDGQMMVGERITLGLRDGNGAQRTMTTEEISSLYVRQFA